MNTKEKIILEATKAFNKNSFGAVSLHEIANQLGISRGNLTYHFKDKDLLLEAISDQMWQKIEAERAKSRKLPSFENLHNEVQLYMKFQKEYAFIFLDNHVLNHSKIKKQFRDMMNTTIRDNKAAIAFAIQLGNMKPEPIPGLYNNLAFNTWMISFFWKSQQMIRGEKNQKDGEKLLWSLIIPHLTEKGIKSFKNFFGADYLKKLGEPFEIDINSMIAF